MFATLFVLLYVAHLLADYPFQTDHQAGHKAGCGAAGWRANLSHAGTHLVLSGLALLVGWAVLDLHVGLVPAAVALLWVAGSHAFVDRRWLVARWMAFARQAGWAQHGGAAHVDQTAHITAIFLAALALAA
ncbi:DUF3307 domain-containing protein [Streptomyces sp. SID14515]|uniref:DUF3307 domain-containing protein n=1 Tax=Streptomyces sp. SID14515 TaxID=2706074 RepID=UPI0013CDC7CE|nr:DUF3307 domain-containing protein [Streptomyces sp. SID14515]NEB42295.1 DUF3307 domain-containing protein [Streptomyces sp. SID14515]